MARTAQPAEPGTDPKPLTVDTATTAEELEQVAEDDLQATVDKQKQELAELKAMVNALARNQAATMPGPAIALPTLESVMKNPPQVQVLTQKGWYVPAIHPTDRKVG